MYNSERATLSKNLFVVSCGLALIFLLAFVWCLNEIPPEDSQVVKVAASPETRFITVIKEDATVEVLLPDGSPAEPCGKVNGTKVEGNCDITGELVNINTLTFFTTVSNPKCSNIHYGGYLLFSSCKRR